MAKWNKVGSLWKNPEKGTLNIKLEKDVKAGYLTLQDPRKSLESSVAAGRLTEEKAQSIREKLHENLKYELFVVDKE